MNKTKDTKGITLIALVITIIILLILAGVTIATLTGENGIIAKAQKAKEETETAGKREEEMVEGFGDYIGGSETGFNETAGANAPKINDGTANAGLIPIKYNGSNWVVCGEDDPEWYSYKEGAANMKWANAMLSDGTYKAGEVKPGQVVQENELGSMFVWIPRYAYSIKQYKTAGTGTEGTTQGITNVEFLKGNSNKGTSGTEYKTSYNGETEVGQATPMIVHPAFTFGGKQLRGIWVAKFEASMKEENLNTTANNNVTDKTVKILPNVDSWRYINQGNIFKTCLNMKENKEYRISNTADTHQMKNTEWGAVAYLAASQYGVVPAINNKAESYKKIENEKEVTKYHAYTGGKDYKTNITQSTTGNVYGVYDMNGGAYEYVAAYYDNRNGNLSGQGGADIFPKNVLDPKYEKYFDKYSVAKDENTKGEAAWNLKNEEGNKQLAKLAYDRVYLNKNKRGDAMYEVINTFSYYGKYADEYPRNDAEGNPITPYAPYEMVTWLVAIYDEKGNVISTGERDEAGNALKNRYGFTFYNQDYAIAGEYSQTFLRRGGNWNTNTNAGVFTSYGDNSGAGSNNGFRPVLAI